MTSQWPAEDVEPSGRGGPDREQAASETAGGPGAGRRHLGGHGHFGVGALEGPQLQPGVCTRREPVGLHGHRLVAGQQGQDGLERLLHHVPLPHRVDAHHEGVGGKRAGTHADHEAAPGQVVE